MAAKQINLKLSNDVLKIEHSTMQNTIRPNLHNTTRQPLKKPKTYSGLNIIKKKGDEIRDKNHKMHTFIKSINSFKKKVENNFTDTSFKTSLTKVREQCCGMFCNYKRVPVI